MFQFSVVGVSVYCFFNKGVDEWVDKEGTEESQSSLSSGCTSQLNRWWNLLKLAPFPKIVINMETEIEISQDFLGNLQSFLLHCSGSSVQMIWVTSPWAPGLAVWILLAQPKCWLIGRSAGWRKDQPQPVLLPPSLWTPSKGCPVSSEEERGSAGSTQVSSEAGGIHQ